MMFSDIVLSEEYPALKKNSFEQIFDALKAEVGAKQDTDVDAEGLKKLVGQFKEYFKKTTGRDFPQDPMEQLTMAIEAVFKSWNNKRANDYRNFHKIPHDLGTAVNVQTMVFGNMGDDSGTGVAFTRDVATGEKVLYGEFLINAQGEDVVAGVRTPVHIDEMKKVNAAEYDQFAEIAERLEKHYTDVMDIEFTMEKGRLFILQCRVGKRTAAAAVKIAVDLVNEGLIDKDTAISRVEPNQIYQLLLPRFDPKEKDRAKSEGRLLAKGLNASPGAAAGLAIFDADKAEELGKEGKSVILVRAETCPDDVHGMLVAKGILTSRGGATSHAAVVARGLGLPCVAGCEAIRVDEEGRLFTVNSTTVKEFDDISIDGTTGEVFAGKLATIDPNIAENKELQQLLEWADERRRLRCGRTPITRATPSAPSASAPRALALPHRAHVHGAGAPPDRPGDDPGREQRGRKAALARLLPYQRGDFKGIFEAMKGLPVVIRLIDPPLHEFLPAYDDLLVEITKLECAGNKPEELAAKRKMLAAVEAQREMNPMLGMRGCRLGLMMPEIIGMQVRAILEAAAEVKAAGTPVKVKIMIPLIGHVNELTRTREYLEAEAQKVVAERGPIDYSFGTMIEIPRAAITADEIAKVAQFISCGTNDLTHTTFGYSRDDAEGKFCSHRRGQDPAGEPVPDAGSGGVGQLVEMAVRRVARPTRTSSWVSAVSTAAIRRASRSATRWA